MAASGAVVADESAGSSAALSTGGMPISRSRMGMRMLSRSTMSRPPERGIGEQRAETTTWPPKAVGMPLYAVNPFWIIALTSFALATCFGVASLMIGRPGGVSFFFRG